MSIARNDPCPCGSGLKYKRCCLKTGGTERNKKYRIAAILALAVVVVAVIVGLTVGERAGYISGVAGLVAIGGYVIFTDVPPPSGKKGDPGAINFGR